MSATTEHEPERHGGSPAVVLFDLIENRNNSEASGLRAPRLLFSGRFLQQP
jgi:hypothetical protein